MLPFVKLTLRIIGSILGVIPTATDNANKSASPIFCLIIPSITITTRHTTTIYLINNLVIFFIPLSKLVTSFFVLTSLPTLPKYVLKPVFITMPSPLPLTTEVPIRQILFISNISFALLFTLLFFSTNILSPVNTDSFKNKSLLSIILKSAGINVPAFNLIISPITTFSTFTSFSSLFLSTFTVEYIFDFNFLLNL